MVREKCVGGEKSRGIPFSDVRIMLSVVTKSDVEGTYPISMQSPTPSGYGVWALHHGLPRCCPELPGDGLSRSRSSPDSFRRTGDVGESLSILRPKPDANDRMQLLREGIPRPMNASAILCWGLLPVISNRAERLLTSMCLRASVVVYNGETLLIG